MGFRAADLDDLLQQTFVVAHRRWDERPRNSGRHRNWLEAIAWRLGMNFRRKRIRRRELLDPEKLDAYAGPTADPEALLDLRRIFDPQSDALMPEDRAMLFAYFVEGTPITEIAELFGLPRSTAWTRLQRIRHDAAEGTKIPEQCPWVTISDQGVKRIE